jgi:hypothetical protein
MKRGWVCITSTTMIVCVQRLLNDERKCVLKPVNLWSPAVQWNNKHVQAHQKWMNFRLSWAKRTWTWDKHVTCSHYDQEEVMRTQCTKYVQHTTQVWDRWQSKTRFVCRRCYDTASRSEHTLACHVGTSHVGTSLQSQNSFHLWIPEGASAAVDQLVAGQKSLTLWICHRSGEKNK